MKSIKLIMLIFFFSCGYKNDPQLDKLFEKYNVNGAMIITSNEAGSTYLYNHSRLKKEFIPASTFKIPNTLIALDEGILSSDTVFTWDGKKREYGSWNSDQTLKSAYDHSCVWCYQELATKVGITKYKFHLKKLDYGNREPSPDVESFWLDGNLRITAYQQIKFLQKLHLGTLPYQTKHMNLVKEIMIQEKSPEYTIRAKSGFSQSTGWYVGYVTVHNQTWFFATNIDIRNKQDLDYRKKITMEALQIKSIL